MPFFQIKNFFTVNIALYKGFRLVEECNRDVLKSGKLKFLGKGCSCVILSLIRRNDSVTLGHMSR